MPPRGGPQPGKPACSSRSSPLPGASSTVTTVSAPFGRGGDPGQFHQPVAFQPEEPPVVRMTHSLEVRLEIERGVDFRSHPHRPRRGEPAIECLRPGAENSPRATQSLRARPQHAKIRTVVIPASRLMSHFLSYHLRPHIRTQHLRHHHAAVGLLIVLHDRHPRAPHRQSRCRSACARIRSSPSRS
jgi:hypothetical protein